MKRRLLSSFLTFAFIFSMLAGAVPAKRRENEATDNEITLPTEESRTQQGPDISTLPMEEDLLPVVPGFGYGEADDPLPDDGEEQPDENGGNYDDTGNGNETDGTDSKQPDGPGENPPKENDKNEPEVTDTDITDNDAGIENDEPRQEAKEPVLPAGYDWKPLIGQDGEPVGGDERWTLSYNFLVYENDVLTTATRYSEEIYDVTPNDHLNIRSFTVATQVNYRNSNQIIDYLPGELKIYVPNIMYGHREDAQIAYDEFIFAVDRTENFGTYSWNMVNEGTDYINMPYFIFTNAVVIRKNANFEGSIRMTYTMYSLPEVDMESNLDDGFRKYVIEPGYDFCEHSFTYNDKVMLETGAGYLYSNEITYDFYRKYLHECEDVRYSIAKSASMVKSPGNVPDDVNMEDYYWVRWDLTVSVPKNIERLYRYAEKLKIADTFPDGCIILQSDGTPARTQTLDGEEFYVITIDPPEPGESVKYYFIAAYPKDKYNQDNDNLGMTNTAHVYALMQGKQDQGYKRHGSSTASVNLGDFAFHYDTGYYAIGKESTSTDKKYFQYINGKDKELCEPFTYNLYPVALYSGIEMDVLVGDDMLYIHSNTNSYRRLLDHEYYFSQIEFPGVMYDDAGQPITTPYEYTLFVRKAGSDPENGFEAYTARGSGTYTYGDGRVFNFTKSDRVVAYYFRIYKVNESIAGDLIYNADGSITLYNNYTIFRNAVIINDAETAKTASAGTVYNFDWINVFDQDGNHLNEVEEDSYGSPGTGLTKQVLARQDMSYYDHYMQRSADSDVYETMVAPEVQYILYAQKFLTSGDFDGEKMGWPMYATLRLNHVAKQISNARTKYLDGIPAENYLIGWDFVERVPPYNTVVSSPEEIIDSFDLPVGQMRSGMHFYCLGEDGIFRDIGREGVVKLAKENARVETFTKNGYDYVKLVIDLSDHPLVISGFWDGGSTAIVDFAMEAKIEMFYSYEGFLADKVNGKRVDNTYYAFYHDRDGVFEPYSKRNVFGMIYANGCVVYDTQDLNFNGITNDHAVFGSANTSVNMPSSTYVNVIKEVADRDDETEFTTGMVKVDYGDEYVYRLSVLNGNNRITNITLYDYVEEYAMNPDGELVKASGNKDFWTGQFDGVDLSDALSKSYIDNVDVYYSQQELPNHYLYLDKDGNNAANGAVEGATLNTADWTLYEEGKTDKSLVKSLAFDFKNKDGTYAQIPTYEKLSISINMSSPSGKEYYSYAYNNFFTTWVALSNTGTDDIIPDIDGINSNIVMVALPHSGQSSVNVDIEKTQAIVTDGVAGMPTKDKLEVKAGDIVRYFITLTCNGSMPAKDLIITDQVPAGLEVLEDTISHGGVYVTDAVKWEFDELSNEEGKNQLVLTFDVKVPDNSQATWTNFAQVIYDDNHDPDDPRENKKSNSVDIERLGLLTISKEVTGKDGDKNRDFTFLLTLIPEDGITLQDYYPTYRNKVSVGELLIFEKNDDGSSGAVITLKHGESITIVNLPHGTKYIIRELGYDELGYDVTVSGDDDDTTDVGIATGSTRLDKSMNVKFTNNKGRPEDPPGQRRTPDDPDPGDNGIPGTGDNSSPLLWLFVLALSVIMVAFIKKRHKEARE